ncbi:hypothetical protein SALBM311S_03707 [Streptomyces alboniger]
MLSPTGWAVAVDAEGRAAGVVSQQTIGEAIRGAHAEGSETDKATPDTPDTPVTKVAP